MSSARRVREHLCVWLIKIRIDLCTYNSTNRAHAFVHGRAFNASQYDDDIASSSSSPKAHATTQRTHTRTQQRGNQTTSQLRWRTLTAYWDVSGSDDRCALGLARVRAPLRWNVDRLIVVAHACAFVTHPWPQKTQLSRVLYNIYICYHMLWRRSGLILLWLFSILKVFL